MRTRAEKGIKNFTDAASQIQYRTAARFFLIARVSSHAAAAKKVDCQRWFTDGERSAYVIAICPFPKPFPACGDYIRIQSTMMIV
jgi:hypothetical protein